MKIFIDPGHSGSPPLDPGAVSGIRYEAADNLRLGLAVQKLFEQQGHQTRMSRTGNVSSSTLQRAAWANDWGADFFLSLHRNVFTSATEYGIETLIHTNASATAKQAATLVQEKLANVAVQHNRGVKSRSDLTVLAATKMPAIQVEIGFITNTRDNELFDKHLNAYASAIMSGGLEALGIQQQPQPPAQYVLPTHWAEEYWNYLNSQGIDVIEMRYDDPIKRGEAFALIARLHQAMNSN
jgi:N-acetylmuramoyl-L-alanine amidase